RRLLAANATEAVTTAAAIADEQRLAGRGQRLARRILLEPLLKFRCRQDYDLAHHRGVPRATKLRAEEVVGAGCLRLEPEHLIAAGQHVVLDAECRHCEVMNDVF